MHESCGPAVADRCWAAVGPMLQASGRLWCAVTRPLGYGSKWWHIVNCTGYMIFMASLHAGGGVCASGKFALADISTRSTSGPSSAGRAVVPPAGCCGVPGLRNSGFRYFFPIALRLERHRGSSSAELPVRFRGDTINIHAWSRDSGPRDLAVGFLAAPNRGPT